MFKFRGQTKSGEWVVGWLICFGEHIKSYVIYHTGDGVICSETHPHALSVSTGKLDSNGVEIFASFEIDGVMTTGGDAVEVEYGKAHTIEGQYDVRYCTRYCAFMAYHKVREDIIYELSDFWDNELTIIGKQGGNR